jgi:hypothetical protein
MDSRGQRHHLLVVRVAGGANNGGNGIIANADGTNSFSDIGVNPQTAVPGLWVNLLTANQASIETDATGWSAISNCSISRITTQSLDGAASLQLSSTAAGNMVTELNPLHGITTSPGKSVMAQAHSKANTAGRNCFLAIRWYNAANTFLSDSFGATVANVTTGWTLYQATATAPPAAASYDIYFTVQSTAGAAELHWIDAMVVIPNIDVSQPQTYATNLSSYNRTRVKERILVAG